MGMGIDNARRHEFPENADPCVVVRDGKITPPPPKLPPPLLNPPPPTLPPPVALPPPLEATGIGSAIVSDDAKTTCSALSAEGAKRCNKIV